MVARYIERLLRDKMGDKMARFVIEQIADDNDLWVFDRRSALADVAKWQSDELRNPEIVKRLKLKYGLGRSVSYEIIGQAESSGNGK